MFDFDQLISMDTRQKVGVFADPKTDNFFAVYNSSAFGSFTAVSDDPREALEDVLRQRKAVQS